VLTSPAAAAGLQGAAWTRRHQTHRAAWAAPAPSPCPAAGCHCSHVWAIRICRAKPRPLARRFPKASRSARTLAAGGRAGILAASRYHLGRTRKTPAILQWPLKTPRFHPGRVLVRRARQPELRRSAHRNVLNCKLTSASGSTSGTRTPRPFVWAKSPDEILEALAAYSERINDSGH
jgi:hypothetical protein